MSEFAELNAPYYIIRSIASDGKALAGVGRILPTYQPVRIDADITIWKITRQGEPGVFRLSLKDSYPYTGVNDGRNVIATVEPLEDKEWRIKLWPEYGAFTIELNTGIRPTLTWTLSPETPDILLSFYEIQPRKSQLFKIEPVLE